MAYESIDSHASPSRLGSMDRLGSSRLVTMGLAYEVCRDRGVVTGIKDAATVEDGTGCAAQGERGPSIDRAGTESGSSNHLRLPALETAFSTKTQTKLRVSRGKSYEGEHFSLSWTITLQVPIKIPAVGESRDKGLWSLLRKGRSKASSDPPRRTKKTILDGLVGRAEKGQLMAVMGSSGCGKTSFLNCISMRNQSFVGNIFVNEKEIDGRYFSLAGFVHQDDLFLPTETVREHLTFHALLRCDPCVRKDLRLKRVETLIKTVNLEHVSDSLLGGPGSFIRGLSGGERRRVSFATELLSDPVIIFADEFTTGLDASMAKSVCLALRKVAAGGRLVIGTIHQPSSDVFALFTHVMLMTQGRVIYMGPRTALAAYFERQGDPSLLCPPRHNPADFFVTLVALHPQDPVGSQKRIDNLVAIYQASPERVAMSDWQQDVAFPELLLYHRSFKMRHFQASSYTQFRLCFQRNVRALFRDPMSFGAALGSGFITGIILGLAYATAPNAPATAEHVRNTEGLFFLANLQVFLIILYATIMAFSAETKVFMRENQAGANRVGAYYLSKTFTGWAVEIAMPFVFALLVWALAGLQRSPEGFFIFAGVMILNALCFGSIGYCLAAMTSDPQIAMAIAPVLVLPNVVFSGIMYDLSLTYGFREFLAYISILRYAQAAMLINEFPPSSTRFTSEIPNQEAVLEGLNAFPLSTNLWALASAAVVFRIIAYLILLLRTSRERIVVR